MYLVAKIASKLNFLKITGQKHYKLKLIYSSEFSKAPQIDLNLWFNIILNTLKNVFGGVNTWYSTTLSHKKTTKTLIE